MRKMTTLYADEGMVLTDGEHYGTTISLAEGDSGENYKEITIEEYEAKLAEEANQIFDGENNNYEVIY